MKTKVSISIILLFTVLSLGSFGQGTKIKYTYDAAGNRTKREIDLSKSMETDSLPAVDSTSADSLFSAENEKAEKPIKDIVGDLSVMIYPNPTRGSLNIVVNNLPDDVANSIEIFNVNGQSIYKNGQLERSNRIDLSREPEGNYFMKIISGEQVIEWKIVKM